MLSSSIGTMISKWLIEQDLTDSFDTHLTFAELGLDSIGSTELALFLEKELRVELDETVVYSYPTIEAFAQYLAELVAVSGDSLSDMSPGATGAPAEKPAR